MCTIAKASPCLTMLVIVEASIQNEPGGCPSFVGPEIQPEPHEFWQHTPFRRLLSSTPTKHMAWFHRPLARKNPLLSRVAFVSPNEKIVRLEKPMFEPTTTGYPATIASRTSA